MAKPMSMSGDTSSFPPVLAVIPCLNEEAHLGPLVETLVADNAGAPLRICIADGGSTDRTPEIARDLAARYPQVTYIHNAKRIQSAAVNLAVAMHAEDAVYLIRLDAHAEYPPGYCRVLVDDARMTGAASVVVSMHTLGDGGFQRAAAAAQNSKLGNGGSAHRNAGGQGKWVDHGHHALMRLDAFRAVGGYDETFSHNEDAELDVRLGKAGHKIWLTGKTFLSYYPRSTPAALFRQYFRFGRGRLRTVLKHRLVPKARQLAPLGVAPAAVLALAAPLFPAAVLPLAAWAGLCLGYGVLLAVRAKDRRIAGAGPAAMVMHMGWSLGFWTGLGKEARK